MLWVRCCNPQRVMLTNSFGLFMKFHFAWSPRVGAGLLALSLAYAAGGCSFLYDLDTSQCDIDDDCLSRGVEFENTVCDVAHHVCIDDPASSGGTSGSDGGGNTGKGGHAGSDNGGTGNEGGTSGSSGGGMAGEAGMGPEPECTTNKQCIEDNLDVPYICKDEKCVKLVTDECPLLLPTEGALDLLKSGSPLVLGGFANMTNTDDYRDTPAAINWDLVYQEFNESTLGGIPKKAGTQPLLGLICNGSYAADDDTTLPNAITHLVGEVGVPGLLTTMSSDRLKAAWDLTQDIVKENNRPVLFVSSVAADLALANLSDDGLMWHFLGDPRTTASTLSSLMRRIEPTVVANRDTADNGPLRVTLIYSSNPTNVDIHTVLTTQDDDHPLVALTFNDKPATDAENAPYFRTVAIPAFAGTQPDVSAAVADLKAHPPNVVVGLVGREFPSVVNQIENWYQSGPDKPVGVARPYWLFSSSSYNLADLGAAVKNFSGFKLSERVLGVTYAEAQDTKSKQLYNEYFSRLTNFYKGQVSVAGTENHYDAGYSLLYAAAATPQLEPTGDDLLGGLEHVLSKGSMSIDIGPSKISSTVASLVAIPTYKMALYGTMGPPDFDTISGTRNNTPTSAWCVADTGVFQADGLIYDASTGKFSNGKPVPACLQQYPEP